MRRRRCRLGGLRRVGGGGGGGGGGVAPMFGIATSPRSGVELGWASAGAAARLGWRQRVGGGPGGLERGEVAVASGEPEGGGAGVVGDAGGDAEQGAAQRLGVSAQRCFVWRGAGGGGERREGAQHRREGE